MKKKRSLAAKAKYYEAHKGDVSIWNPAPLRFKVGKTTTILSIRANREELTLLNEQAVREGVTITKMIKRIALEHSSPAMWVTTTGSTTQGGSTTTFSLTRIA